MTRPTVYFCCGVGGSGMSALAQLLRRRGHRVIGSDRGHDRGLDADLYRRLVRAGIELAPQDGSGVGPEVDVVVVSSAVEASIPDVRVALERRLPVRRRAELLAEMFNRHGGIAVAGTSGKSTITGMIGHVLAVAGRDPTVVNGGVTIGAADSGLGNIVAGRDGPMVIEADESDGTIALYDPEVAVVANITVDHKPMAELRPLFRHFRARSRRAAVLNADCPEAAALGALAAGRTLTFSTAGAAADFRVSDVNAAGPGIRFTLNGVGVQLRVPGVHNAANAAAAVAACSVYGIPVGTAAKALGTFAGIKRRLQLLGVAARVAVIDDFAHNPDKIRASLAALRCRFERLRVLYQPHGFGPTRFLKDGLVAAFVETLRADDMVAMPEIYDAGGTADRSISAAVLVDGIRARGRQAFFATARSAAAAQLLQAAAGGDALVVMGARDATLTGVADRWLEQLRGRSHGR